MARRFDRGFTLIELVIVIVIASIIAAVGFFTAPAVIRAVREVGALRRTDEIASAVRIHYGFMATQGFTNPVCGTPFPLANDLNNNESRGVKFFTSSEYMPINPLVGANAVQQLELNPGMCGNAAPKECGDVHFMKMGYAVGYYYSALDGSIWPATDDCAKFNPLES